MAKGSSGKPKKPAHGKKAKIPRPASHPEHEMTYSADERALCPRTLTFFSESSPRPNTRVAAAIVAVVVRNLVCQPFGPQLALVPHARHAAGGGTRDPYSAGATGSPSRHRSRSVGSEGVSGAGRAAGQRVNLSTVAVSPRSAADRTATHDSTSCRTAHTFSPKRSAYTSSVSS